MPDVVLCQRWSIVESGHPVTRGDFCSLHIDKHTLERFIRLYWQEMFLKVPDSYATPTKKDNAQVPPYICAVDPKTYKRVFDSGIGLWSTTVPPEASNAVAMIREDDLVTLFDGLRR